MIWDLCSFSCFVYLFFWVLLTLLVSLPCLDYIFWVRCCFRLCFSLDVCVWLTKILVLCFQGGPGGWNFENVIFYHFWWQSYYLSWLLQRKYGKIFLLATMFIGNTLFRFFTLKIVLQKSVLTFCCNWWKSSCFIYQRTFNFEVKIPIFHPRVSCSFCCLQIVILKFWQKV